LVSSLGELTAGEQAGWARIGRILEDRPVVPPSRFSDGAADDPVPERVDLCVRGVRVENTRAFGEVFLALSLWRVLGLDDLLADEMVSDREEVPWPVMAAILAAARFCAPSSELHVAQTWYRGTALSDLLGVGTEAVNADRLYRTLDRILPHKAAIERQLKERFACRFDAEFDLLLYDVTRTYLEGAGEENPQARHGRARRIGVLDRGMIDEDNRSFLRARGGSYIVGTPKAQLKPVERFLLAQGWTEVQAGIQIKLCPGPQGTETFVLCCSEARAQKERAIHDRFELRIEKGLTKLAGRLAKARQPDRVQVERQIGRLLGSNTRAAGLFDIHVTEGEGNGGKGLTLTWSKRETWRAWSPLSEGGYLLRTNLTDGKPEDLWKSYIPLTQAEAAFRTCKSELHLRPIWHRLRDRVHAHILFSFLAYQPVEKVVAVHTESVSGRCVRGSRSIE